MYRATGDQAMRDKAAYLLGEFSKTISADGNCRMNVYPYEKLVCGLVDMHELRRRKGSHASARKSHCLCQQDV